MGSAEQQPGEAAAPQQEDRQPEQEQSASPSAVDALEPDGAHLFSSWRGVQVQDLISACSTATEDACKARQELLAVNGQVLDLSVQLCEANRRLDEIQERIPRLRASSRLSNSTSEGRPLSSLSDYTSDPAARDHLSGQALSALPEGGPRFWAPLLSEGSLAATEPELVEGVLDAEHALPHDVGGAEQS